MIIRIDLDKRTQDILGPLDSLKLEVKSLQLNTLQGVLNVFNFRFLKCPQHQWVLRDFAPYGAMHQGKHIPLGSNAWVRCSCCGMATTAMVAAKEEESS